MSCGQEDGDLKGSHGTCHILICGARPPLIQESEAIMWAGKPVVLSQLKTERRGFATMDLTRNWWDCSL